MFDKSPDELPAELIRPDWPAPEGVRACITTRSGGFSHPPYNTLNLGDHVGDRPEHVARNRAKLRRQLDLPSDPLWLDQVHGCAVATFDRDPMRITADAAIADLPGRVCAVLTADCLPLLVCNSSGTRVAAVHAGWRGLAAGVIEAALTRFNDPGESLLAWLGPAISPAAFEVGEEVRAIFIKSNPTDEFAFRPAGADHWMADIYQLARNRLASYNLGYIGGGDSCTVKERERFFSFRRDGITGRMASLIWIEPD